MIIASGISPMLEIDLSASAAIEISRCLQACSSHTVTYTHETTSTRRETVTVPRTTTSVSSRSDPKEPFEWNATKAFAKGI